jgi:hypothetical protein
MTIAEELFPREIKTVDIPAEVSDPLFSADAGVATINVHVHSPMRHLVMKARELRGDREAAPLNLFREQRFN